MTAFASCEGGVSLAFCFGFYRASSASAMTESSEGNVVVCCSGREGVGHAFGMSSANA